MTGWRDLPNDGWGRPPRTRLTRRGRVLAYALVFLAAAALGACDPLWRSMPWAVTP